MPPSARTVGGLRRVPDKGVDRGVDRRHDPPLPLVAFELVAAVSSAAAQRERRLLCRTDSPLRGARGIGLAFDMGRVLGECLLADYVKSKEG
jgi:hypothetical protein